MDSEALTSSQTLQLRPARALDSLLLTPWSSSTLALSEPPAISTSTLPGRTTVRVFALWRNDYAAQDPINNYDLDGKSCKWAGVFGHWAKKACHKIASPAVTIRDELEAQANAANASVASAAMGSGRVQPQGPISGPANSPSPLQHSAMHTASCFLGASGVILAITGGIIEPFEARAAAREGGSSVLSNWVGRAHGTAGSALLVGWGATGFCGIK